jgi:hypothetical protein
MFKYHLINENCVIAELTDESFVLKEAQDALDLIMSTGTHECSRFIIYKKNLHDDFFNLSSGLAGDILQKFSNYRIKLAVIGDFSGFRSKNLNDFFRESNRVGHILFLTNVGEALTRLSI